MKLLFFLLRWHYNTKNVFLSLNMHLPVEVTFAHDFVITIVLVHASKCCGECRYSLCKNNYLMFKSNGSRWLLSTAILLTVL